jgi:hypothetical protein
MILTIKIYHWINSKPKSERDEKVYDNPHEDLEIIHVVSVSNIRILSIHKTGKMFSIKFAE